MSKGQEIIDWIFSDWNPEDEKNLKLKEKSGS